MENASKALIMVGSILIGMMVISLLVIFYGNLRNINSLNQKVDVDQQAVEFNKQFDTYDRNKIYGSEILSLVNKVYDYNKTQADNIGYTELTLKIKFENPVSVIDKGVIIDTKGDYVEIRRKSATEKSLEDIINGIENVVDDYSKKDKTFDGVKINIVTISGMRTEALKIYLKDKGITNPTTIDTINNEKNKYLSYRSALTEIKSKTFKPEEEFKYDNNTSRITEMKFIET